MESATGFDETCWPALAVLGVLALAVVAMAREPALSIALVGALALWWLKSDPFASADVFVPFALALLVGGIAGPVAFVLSKLYLASNRDIDIAIESFRTLAAIVERARGELGAIEGNILFWALLAAVTLAVSLGAGITGLVSSVKRLKEAVLTALLVFSAFLGFDVTSRSHVKREIAAIEATIEQRQTDLAELAARLQNQLQDLRLSLAGLADQRGVFAALVVVLEQLKNGDSGDNAVVAKATQQLQDTLARAGNMSYEQVPAAIRQTLSRVSFVKLEEEDRRARSASQQNHFSQRSDNGEFVQHRIDPQQLPRDLPALLLVEALPRDPSPAQLASAHRQIRQGEAALAQIRRERRELDAATADKLEAINVLVQEIVPPLAAEGFMTLVLEAVRNLGGALAVEGANAAVRHAADGSLDPVVDEVRRHASKYRRIQVWIAERLNQATHEARTLAAQQPAHTAIVIPSDPRSPTVAETRSAAFATATASQLAMLREAGLIGEAAYLPARPVRQPMTGPPFAFILSADAPETMKANLLRDYQQQQDLQRGAPSAAQAREIANWKRLREPLSARPSDGGVRRAELARRQYAASYFAITTPEAYADWAEAQDRQLREEMNRQRSAELADQRIAATFARERQRQRNADIQRFIQKNRGMGGRARR